MPTPNIETARGWLGRVVVDRDSNKIGEVVDIYMDNETGRPDWAVVRTGLFGMRSTFVPLGEAHAPDDCHTRRRLANNGASRHSVRIRWPDGVRK